MERLRSHPWHHVASLNLWLGLGLLLASGLNPRGVLAQPPDSNPESAIAPRLTAKTDADAAVASNNAFALDLYRQLSQLEGNLCISPYSLATALSLTYAGARNETAEEMAKVLHLTLDSKRLHSALQQIAIALQTSTQSQLRITNRLWLQKGFDLNAEFTDVLAQNYQAPLAEVDFAATPEDARQTINQWTAQQTNDRVQNLLAPSAITPLTKLVLTNSTYFKGQWHYPFANARTVEAPFYLKADETVSVPVSLMTGTFSVNYAKLPELKLLELPYAGQSLSMVLLLPVAGTDLTTVEQKLTSQALEEWLTALRSQPEPPEKIFVQLPKFKLSSTLDLQSTLAEMGMNLPFSGLNADFSGIRAQKSVFISKVVQQAFVEVNEAGTEATTATAVSTGRGGMSGFFKADRPFLFLIRDRQTGVILFMGRVTNPLK